MKNNKGNIYYMLGGLVAIAILALGFWLYFYDKGGDSFSQTGDQTGDQTRGEVLVTGPPLKPHTGQAALEPEVPLPSHLTPNFWKNVTPEELTENLKTIQNPNEVHPITGQSMLHLALLYGEGKHPEMISTLIEAGVDYKLKDHQKDGTSGRPLFFASALGPKLSLPYVTELLKHDTEVNEPGNVFFDGMLYKATALNRAVFHRMPLEGIKLLLDKGADPNTLTNNDISSLMMSVVASPDGPVDLPTAQLLLDRGADKNQKSTDGKTAYDFLMENTQVPKDSPDFKALAEKLKPNP